MSTISKANRTANPKLTRNGRPRLKPLNLAQVKDLLEKTGRPRDKAKISNRLKVLQKVRCGEVPSVTNGHHDFIVSRESRFPRRIKTCDAHWASDGDVLCS